MDTVHLDFAELSKKSGPGTQTRAFLVAIDRNTRFAVARAGGQNAQAVISLLRNRVFDRTKKIVSDHAKVFQSRRLREWASERGIEIVVGSPYNQQSNGLAERLIRDLKTFISMYPEPQHGWKESLEAAVRHHNRAFCSTIGCSPSFALNGTPTYLPADDRLGIRNSLRLRERRNSADEENKCRSRQARNFDRRHAARMPNVEQGDRILVRRGTSKQDTVFCGPFLVTAVEVIQGIQKRVVYVEDSIEKSVAIRNVIKYHPRRE